MTGDGASSLLVPQPLAGKGALITGAATGIGKAIARGLAHAGASVLLVDRDASGLAETRSEIIGSGGVAQTHVADLADRAQVDTCVDAGVSAFEAVDILVNAAGITGPGKSFLASDETAWDTVFAVNVTAPYILMKRFAAHLVERGAEGRIVNITSSSAHRARMSVAAYGASKSALMQLTRSAAADLGQYGINVNAIAPGLTATQIVTSNFEDERLAQALRDGPIANFTGRISQPSDIADTALFLCLPASRQITGQTIHVSAGAVV